MATRTHMPDQVIKNGKLVSLTYHICDDSGAVLEQSDFPVNYIHGGQNELIGGMDQAVAGKCVGDVVDLILDSDHGFGPYDSDLTFTDSIENVPPQFRHLGAEVEMQNEAGDSRTFYVTKIEGEDLTVDGNHPFSGRNLRVKVKIHDVRDPTDQERTQDEMSHVAPAGIH